MIFVINIIWRLTNPHEKREDRSQYQFKINLWTGILNGQIVGPFELPAVLNGENYLNFLENYLPVLLEGLPEEFSVGTTPAAAHYQQGLEQKSSETEK